MQYDPSTTPVNTSRLGITSQHYIRAKCEVRNEWLHYLTEIHGSKPVPWLSRLVAVLSTRKTGPVHVGFVVDKVTLGQVFLRVLLLSSVTVIPPMVHVRFCINNILIRRTRGPRLGNIKNQCPIRGGGGGPAFSHLKGIIKKIENRIIFY
jgi:hypothetical protein